MDQRLSERLRAIHFTAHDSRVFLFGNRDRNEPGCTPERPLLHRWRTEAGQAGREIKRTVAAYEAGRDGFWLARWLRARASRPTSSIRPVSRCRANIGARRLIASTQNY